MGPTSYKRSVVDRNVVMLRMTTSRRFDVSRHFCFKMKTTFHLKLLKPSISDASSKTGILSRLVGLCLYMRCDRPVCCARNPVKCVKDLFFRD